MSRSYFANFADVHPQSAVSPFPSIGPYSGLAVSPIPAVGVITDPLGRISHSNSPSISQSCLESDPQIVGHDGNRKVRASIPAQRSRADADHYFLCLGGIAEGSFSPAIGVAQDLRRHAQTRHRCVGSESDERASSLARGARESHRLGAFGLDPGEHHQCKSSTAKQFLRSTESVLSAARPKENRALFPERTSNGAKAIDPYRSFTLGDGGVAGSTEHCRRSTLRHPDSQSAAGQAMSGKNRIECFDASPHWFRRPVGDRCSIWKSMLDECADGGVSVRHSSAGSPEHIPKARKKPATFTARDRIRTQLV